MNSSRAALRRSDRFTLVAMLFMVCLWVIWDGWAAFFVVLERSTMSNSAILVDFGNLYKEGSWWLSGAYLNPHTHDFTYPYAYPPSSLPLFGFFAQFDLGIAALVWTNLALAIFVIAFLSAVSVLKSDRKYLFVSFAALLFFTSYGVRIGLQLGNISLLLTSLVFLSLVTQRSKHCRVSAMLLAAASLLTAQAALFLLYFVVFWRDLRYLLHFLESTVVIVGLSLLIVPVQLYWTWTVKVSPTLLSAVIPFSASVTGIISLWGLSYLNPIVLAATVSIFAAFAYRVYPNLLRRMRTPSAAAADAVFLMNSLLIPLFLAKGWPQDYVWVVLPFALFLSELLAEKANTIYFLLVGLAAFLFNLDAYPLLTYFYYYYDYYPQIAMINYEHYFPVFATTPTGLIASLLIVPALILLLMRPQTVLPNFPHKAFRTKRSVGK